MKRRKGIGAHLLLLFLLSSFAGGQNVAENTISDDFGLTAYGEPCSDECQKRGFSYAWCHKAASRNGTWVDRDYCSPSPGLTRYLERCLDKCGRRDGQPFYSCATKVTKRGDWDYCSPFQADLQCAWSQWGPWSECSGDCEAKSRRTRRRRIEQVGQAGRVGQCSGEIEQSIKSCFGPPCPVARPFDCVWGTWGSWAPCSVSCGGGGKQTRSRLISVPPSSNGEKCSNEDSTQTISCSRIEQCPVTSEEQPTNKTLLGSLTGKFHGVGGQVYALDDHRLVIDRFRYDGTGPDAFFWVGSTGLAPHEQGVLLPYPFKGQFYEYTDAEAPVLGRFVGDKSVELTLPPDLSVGDLRWISVWCRRFSLNFGDLILDNNTDVDGEVVKDIPETPRSVATPTKTSSNKLATIKEQIEEAIEEVKKNSKQPFTVIRVSSSVSQVRPKVVLLNDTGEEDSFDEVPRDDSVEVTTTTEAAKKARPPFLRPVAKFPEIRIPTLESNPGRSALFDRSRPTTSSPLPATTPEIAKSRLTIFNRPPPASFVIGGRGRVTTSTGLDTVSTVSLPKDHQNEETTPSIGSTTTESLLDKLTKTQASLAENDSGISNFARIPVEKFPMTTDDVLEITTEEEEEEETLPDDDQVEESDSITNGHARFPISPNLDSPPEGVTTPSPGSTRLLEVVKISLPDHKTSTLPTTVEDETTTRRRIIIEPLPPALTTPPPTAAPTTPEPAPDSTPQEEPRKQNGRSGSRFKGINSIRLLFPKRKPFIPINRVRSTETPFTTSKESILLAGFGVRSTTRPFTTPPSTARPVRIRTTERSVDDFKARRPFNRLRTTRAPRTTPTPRPGISGSTPGPTTTTSTTERVPDEERIDVIKKLMKEDVKVPVTLFYPDYDYSEETEEEVRSSSNKDKPDKNSLRPGLVKISPKFRSTTTTTISSSTPRLTFPTTTPIPDFDDDDDNLFVTPSSPAYDPCAIPDACGPNALCTTRNSDPICSCPAGFSGIPRDGVPDPSHGCVRTPTKCSPDASASCAPGQSCVRDLCLPDCQIDSECSLGERCVNASCIKICFYDAHCLAGEFCEKGLGNGNGNGVCLAGCRRDTNCPFGQICVGAEAGGEEVENAGGRRGRCENGCHFNNDCTLNTACIQGNCTSPCDGFGECGANAECQVVSHAPTCRCPAGHRELNSPYVACVPANMDLASINCLRNSDCHSGSACVDWQCRPG